MLLKSSLVELEEKKEKKLAFLSRRNSHGTVSMEKQRKGRQQKLLEILLAKDKKDPSVEDVITLLLDGGVF